MSGEIVSGAGSKVSLLCINHPDLRWHTKNIDYIGARSIFFIPAFPGQEECKCSGNDLIPSNPEHQVTYFLDDPNEGESFAEGTENDTWEWGDEHLHDTPPNWAVKVQGRRASRFS